MTTPARFSGTDGVSGERWLRSLTYDLPAPLTPGQWLERVDGLLTGDAARWAEQHPRVRQILTDERFDHGTEEAVSIFVKALNGRFPSLRLPPDPTQVERYLATLKQESSEDLESYYRRTERSLHALGGVDRSEAPLTDLEYSISTKVINKFMQGLNDSATRDVTDHYWRRWNMKTGFETLGLNNVYQLAKEFSSMDEYTKQALPILLRSQAQWPPPGFSSDCISFNSLFGSSGDSHDLFTRSRYGSYEEGDVISTVGPTGFSSRPIDSTNQGDTNTTIAVSVDSNVQLPPPTITVGSTSSLPGISNLGTAITSSPLPASQPVSNLLSQPSVQQQQMTSNIFASQQPARSTADPLAHLQQPRPQATPISMPTSTSLFSSVTPPTNHTNINSSAVQTPTISIRSPSSSPPSLETPSAPNDSLLSPKSAVKVKSPMRASRKHNHWSNFPTTTPRYDKATPSPFMVTPDGRGFQWVSPTESSGVPMNSPAHTTNSPSANLGTTTSNSGGDEKKNGGTRPGFKKGRVHELQNRKV